jgi:hypothetical protein
MLQLQTIEDMKQGGSWQYKYMTHVSNPTLKALPASIVSSVLLNSVFCVVLLPTLTITPLTLASCDSVQSYLVSLFLDCPPGLNITCPDTDAKQVNLEILPFSGQNSIDWSSIDHLLSCMTRISFAVQAFVDAIQAGNIWWHAMPFNAQLELMDKSMLQANIQLTHDLDAQLSLPAKITMSQARISNDKVPFTHCLCTRKDTRTLNIILRLQCYGPRPKVASVCVQRDVVGFTRGAVPILAGQGIKAVTVGTNGGCAPPDVPHNTVFIWSDVASGTQILAMWHPGAQTCSAASGDAISMMSSACLVLQMHACCAERSTSNYLRCLS